MEKLEDFYKRKFDWIPEDLKKGLGHFNIFRLENLIGKPIPYKRRDFYKIMLVKGNSKVHFADKVVEVEKQAISFSNPTIPYKWEHLDNVKSGYFCIFNDHFIQQYTDLNKYSVFQPQGEHIFELDDEQFANVEEIYLKMFEEIESEYIHKYDVLRNLMFELLHFAMKLQPTSKFETQAANASQRICMLFLELLERQYPIEENHPKVNLRSPSDFALQLNVHVNHLNKAVKEATQKTTSQLIAERLIKEAKILLKHSNWNVSQIAYALGFNEVTHFSNFFKKHLNTTPSSFRKV